MSANRFALSMSVSLPVLSIITVSEKRWSRSDDRVDCTRLILCEDRMVKEVGICQKEQLTHPLKLVNKSGPGIGLSFGNMIKELSVFCCNADKMFRTVSSWPSSGQLGVSKQAGDRMRYAAPIIAVLGRSGDRS